MLRHVGPAFVEDPVRILRVARFAARFDFAIAPATLELMREMVVRGEVDALVAERVWQELSRGLMERRPSRLLAALDACGALAVVLRELARELSGPRWRSDSRCSMPRRGGGADLPQRFALLTMHAAEAALAALCERLRVPQECADLALLAARQRDNAAHAGHARCRRLAGAAAGGRRLAAAGALRAVAGACSSGTRRQSAPAYARLRAALAAAQAVDAGAIAKTAGGSEQIRDCVAAARVAAIFRRRWKNSQRSPAPCSGARAARRRRWCRRATRSRGRSARPAADRG